MNLADTIAHAIKEADKSYFFEDYMRQAQAVIAALDREGMMIVPRTATEVMMQAGKDAILSGRVKPENLAQTIYTAMVAVNGRKAKKV